MKLKFLSALLLSSALASAAAAAPDSASEKAWQIGDIVEFADVDLPGTPRIQKEDGECFLSSPTETVPLLWKVAETDPEGGRILLVALHGIKASSYCHPSVLEDSGSCSFAESVIAGDHLNGMETNSLRQSVSVEGLEPYDSDKGLYFFILSAREALKYFPSPEERLLYPMPASSLRPGKADLDSRLYGWWWLRGNEKDQLVPFVDFSGRLHQEGTQPFHGGGLIRPAVWVRTDAFPGHRSPHGTTVTMGSWPQASATAKSPLKWIVLAEDREQHRLLVIAEEGIEFLPFGSANADIEWDWKTSQIRTFLNRDFLRKAFTPAEQKRIRKSRVISNSLIFSDDSKDTETEDKIFLPDAALVMRYMPEFSLRNSRITPYVRDKIKKASSAVDYEIAPLILLRERSLGIECYDGCTTMQHLTEGHLNTDGERPASESFVIRPVMWISAE